MQETLTTEIFNQIDCIKLHLRNLQEVAEIEKMLPVSCDELHKGIAEMEKSLVHLMNFEKLLKGKIQKREGVNLTNQQAGVLVALTTAAAINKPVFLSYNDTFIDAVKSTDTVLYWEMFQENCIITREGSNFFIKYPSTMLRFSGAIVTDIVTKVKPGF